MGICCISICGAICFNSALSRTLEITLIVLDSIAFVLYFLCLVIIKWKELSKINVVFFVFMFLMVVACLVFSILIRLWRSKNLIKTLKKNVGGNLALSGFIIVIVHFVLCLIEEIVFTIGVLDANHPCLDLNKYPDYNPYIYRRRLKTKVDCSGKNSDYYEYVISYGEFVLAYFTFSYMEIALILDMIIWNILRNRIKLELDGPPQPPVIQPNPMMDPYGRAVVVVQPGDVVMMGGNQYQYNPYAQNQPGVDVANVQYPPPGSASNEFQVQEKIA